MSNLIGAYNEVISTLDCGDNSCMWKKKNKYWVYGMRTNGGCRCLRELPNKQRWALQKLLKVMKETL